jgi:hypothetical protein
MRCLYRADRLLMEGYSQLTPTPFSVEDFTILSAEHLDRPVIYLEDGLDETALCTPYGIHPNEAMMHQALRFNWALETELRSRNATSTLDDRMRCWKAQQLCERRPEAHIDEVIVRLQLLRAVDNELLLLARASTVYDLYLAKIRDRETLGPRIMQYREGLSVVTTGAGHTEALKTLARGESLNPLPPWQEAIKDLIAPYTSMLEYIGDASRRAIYH